MKNCVVTVPPLANHAVIFNTTEFSYHGYPDPISCPRDTTRKSLALYYYTAESDHKYRAKATNYRARPGDGTRAALIWLDNIAVEIYSKLKSRLGLSDDFIGKILGKLSR